MDDPVKYFTAQALTDRAGSLTSLLAGMSNGIQTIKAASTGLDTITNYVKSMQAVVQQAQTSAAQNLPKISGTQALGNANLATAAGKSLRDYALGMTLNTPVAPARVGPNGNVGLATTVNMMQISAGNASYSYSISATDTVADLVSQINKSGIATASVDAQGLMQVVGEGSDPLTISLGGAATAPATGFTANAQATTRMFGARATAVVGGLTSAARTALIDQFNTLRGQIDSTAKGSGVSGVNLLNGDKTSIIFNELTGPEQANLTVQGTLTNSTNLGIGLMQDLATSAGGSNFGIQNNADLTKASEALTNALDTLKAQSNVLSLNMSIIMTRQDFTKSMTNILNTGASNLTAADMNEEAANSNALQIQQSLGVSALSLANQANQSILQLLR
ncbi:hypothetical protein ASF60_19445 [Methylobacterium sp. Leaf113]|nr:hypothetical protein ASF60_19445 [Methylobacterium sp. Leaf113]